MITVYEPSLNDYKTSAIEAINSGWISNHGEYIQKSTDKLKELINIKYCILMSNGTCATHCLFLSIKFKYPDIKGKYDEALVNYNTTMPMKFVVEKAKPNQYKEKPRRLITIMLVLLANNLIALLFLLLNGVILHRLPELQAWLGLNLSLTSFTNHFWVSMAVLILPVLIPFVGYGNLYLLSNSVVKLKSCSFIELAYGYLPIALGANLAHYLRFFCLSHYRVCLKKKCPFH
jgi:hypothetical protein